MKCVNLISNESTKSAITYSLSKLENKVRVIEGLTEEKWITSATIELPSNKYKIKMLSKIKNLYFKNCIIQSLNINDNEIKNELNTIEFRLANGTIDANTWIENATLFGNIIATSQKLSEIQQKETKTEKEQEILNKFELLKTKYIRNENRLNIFLDLCVPDEFRQVFIDRYI